MRPLSSPSRALYPLPPSLPPLPTDVQKPSIPKKAFRILPGPGLLEFYRALGCPWAVPGLSLGCPLPGHGLFDCLDLDCAPHVPKLGRGGGLGLGVWEAGWRCQIQSWVSCLPESGGQVTNFGFGLKAKSKTWHRIHQQKV